MEAIYVETLWKPAVRQTPLLEFAELPRISWLIRGRTPPILGLWLLMIVAYSLCLQQECRNRIFAMSSGILVVYYNVPSVAGRLTSSHFNKSDFSRNHGEGNSHLGCCLL